MRILLQQNQIGNNHYNYKSCLKKQLLHKYCSRKNVIKSLNITDKNHS